MSRSARSLWSRLACWLFDHVRGEVKSLGWSGYVDQSCARCGCVERQDWNGSGPARHGGWQ